MGDSHALPRSRPRVTALWVAIVSLAAALLATPAGAQDGTAAIDRFERLDSASSTTYRPLALDGDRTVHVMLELRGDPVAVARSRGSSTNAQRTAYARGLERTQDRVASEVRARGGSVESRLQYAYNGLRVRAKASDVAALAQLQDVEAVHAIPQHQPTNADSVPYLGVPSEVWDDLGYTGDGVSIAVIDTGIDYTHATFGGSGDPADYAANDPTVIETGTFPTAKVVGGHDFVGDAYDASSDDPALTTPNPDPDPLDCNAHGTHVAGTAGGYGVADGTTYAGPYDATTHDTTFDVGPGVAPLASLYALKVFGCDGSTDVTVDAIEWAVEHEVDVINMSLGAPFGTKDDPSAVASTNAAMDGVVVVASAGNSGPAPYITGSPGTGVGSISVAALDTIESIPMATYDADGAAIAMQNSNGAEIPAGGITGEVLVLQDDPATTDVDESLGCNESDFTHGGVDPTGKIVITWRAVCARIDRAIHGQAVGAAAVVMINNTGGFPPYEGLIAGVDIPFLGALAADEGSIVATDGTTITIVEAAPRANATYEHFADFSSGGPRSGDSGAKPDVTAPGVSIASAFVGSGTGNVRLSGTSMAAPHVAGVAALVRQSKPGWDVEDVKAAIVNSGDPARVADHATRVGGSGLVTPGQAVASDVVAVGDAMTASLSYGLVRTDTAWSEARTITLRNHGTVDVALGVSVEVDEDARGYATATPTATSVTVPAGGTATVDLELAADLAGLSSTGAGFTPATGRVLLSDGAGTDLRVPYQAVLKPESAVTTAITGSSGTTSGPRTVELTSTNTSGAYGTVDVYAWGLDDREGDSLAADVRAVGVQNFPDAFGAGTSLGVFAFNTFTRNNNPAVNEWDVLLDVDEDGTWDQAVIGIDLGLLLTGSFSGELVSASVDLATGEATPLFYAGGGLDTSTVILPFIPELLGLDADANPDFRYTAAAYSFEGLGDDLVTSSSAIDLWDAPAEFGQFEVVAPGASATWTATFETDRVRRSGVLGWMAVTVEDAFGAPQADLIELPERKGGPSGPPATPPGKGPKG